MGCGASKPPEAPPKPGTPKVQPVKKYKVVRPTTQMSNESKIIEDPMRLRVLHDWLGNPTDLHLLYRASEYGKGGARQKDEVRKKAFQMDVDGQAETATVLLCKGTGRDQDDWSRQNTATIVLYAHKAWDFGSGEDKLVDDKKAFIGVLESTTTDPPEKINVIGKPNRGSVRHGADAGPCFDGLHVWVPVEVSSPNQSPLSTMSPGTRGSSSPNTKELLNQSFCALESKGGTFAPLVGHQFLTPQQEKGWDKERVWFFSVVDMEVYQVRGKKQKIKRVAADQITEQRTVNAFGGKRSPSPKRRVSNV